MSRFNRLLTARRDTPTPQAAATQPLVTLPPVANVPAAKPATCFTPPQESVSAVQSVGFFIVLAYVFARFSLISEITTFGLGYNLYIIVIVGPLAALATIVTGGIRRFLLAPPAYFLIGFMLWLVVAVPFSTWHGGSFALLKNAFMTDFSMFFMIVALTRSWRQCVLLMNAIAIGGAVDFITTRIYGADEVGRLVMSFGTLGNPNDLATHLLITLPFCILLILNNRSIVVRPLAACAAVAMLYAIIQTGSRGALLSVAAVVIYIFFKGSPMLKIGLAVGGVIVVVLTMALLPSGVMLRYATIFNSDYQAESGTEAQYEYAVSSEEARKQLLIDSVLTTLAHPLFGVGPGNYASADAGKKNEAGQHASWQVTHNSYTQVSSESGIPGLVLFLGMIISTFKMVGSTYRQTRKRPELQYLSNTAFALLITLAGFSVNIFFSALAYNYYLPTLVAISIVFCTIARQHIQRFESQSVASPVPVASTRRAPATEMPARRSAPLLNRGRKQAAPTSP
jgi:O-antigen ligase